MYDKSSLRHVLGSTCNSTVLSDMSISLEESLGDFCSNPNHRVWLIGELTEFINDRAMTSRQKCNDIIGELVYSEEEGREFLEKIFLVVTGKPWGSDED